MKACGLIVEYNPFHHGHLYHLHEAKKRSNADCIIAVMSGPFMQRGEPAIIDKFHRARVALQAGVDIVLELPYAYAVQSSDFFAKGAVHTLNEMKVDTICFGSEHGIINDFSQAVQHLTDNVTTFQTTLHSYLNKGLSYPVSSSKAYEQINLTELSLHKPNNILGFSYVKEILETDLSIEPITIERISNNYHDQAITGNIASATSIRKEMLQGKDSAIFEQTMPDYAFNICLQYKERTNLFHEWEIYFPYLQYLLLMLNDAQLREFHGVDEGIEYRIIKAIKNATTFRDLVELVKTKRYTVTRLQRMFVHILTNTKKDDIKPFLSHKSVPYVRLLGMNRIGQQYLNNIKKQMNVPIISGLNKQYETLLSLDEKAQNGYYTPFCPDLQKELRKQEFQLPIFS